MSDRAQEAPAPARGEITRLLMRWGRDDREAHEQLWPLVYDELIRVARWHLARERRTHTLQTRDLIHEAFLRLVGVDRIDWQDRAHFFAFSSRVMRRILIDRARRRLTGKHGAGERPTPLDEALQIPPSAARELVALDDSLTTLEGEMPELAEVVRLKYFGGLTQREIAAAIGSSERTVRRRWRLARAWLYDDLNRGEPS